MSTFDETKRKWVYDQLNKTYEMGTYDQFKKDMADPEKRKWAHDKLNETYDMEPQAEFDNNVFEAPEPATPKPETPANTTPTNDTKPAGEAAQSAPAASSAPAQATEPTAEEKAKEEQAEKDRKAVYDILAKAQTNPDWQGGLSNDDYRSWSNDKLETLMPETYDEFKEDLKDEARVNYYQKLLSTYDSWKNAQIGMQRKEYNDLLHNAQAIQDMVNYQKWGSMTPAQLKQYVRGELDKGAQGNIELRPFYGPDGARQGYVYKLSKDPADHYYMNLDGSIFTIDNAPGTGELTTDESLRRLANDYSSQLNDLFEKNGHDMQATAEAFAKTSGIDFLSPEDRADVLNRKDLSEQQKLDLLNAKYNRNYETFFGYFMAYHNNYLKSVINKAVESSGGEIEKKNEAGSQQLGEAINDLPANADAADYGAAASRVNHDVDAERRGAEAAWAKVSPIFEKMFGKNSDQYKYYQAMYQGQVLSKLAKNNWTSSSLELLVKSGWGNNFVVEAMRNSMLTDFQRQIYDLSVQSDPNHGFLTDLGAGIFTFATEYPLYALTGAGAAKVTGLVGKGLTWAYKDLSPAARSFVSRVTTKLVEGGMEASEAATKAYQAYKIALNNSRFGLISRAIQAPIHSGLTFGGADAIKTGVRGISLGYDFYDPIPEGQVMEDGSIHHNTGLINNMIRDGWHGTLSGSAMSLGGLFTRGMAFGGGAFRKTLANVLGIPLEAGAMSGMDFWINHWGSDLDDDELKSFMENKSVTKGKTLSPWMQSLKAEDDRLREEYFAKHPDEDPEKYQGWWMSEDARKAFAFKTFCDSFQGNLAFCISMRGGKILQFPFSRAFNRSDINYKIMAENNERSRLNKPLLKKEEEDWIASQCMEANGRMKRNYSLLEIGNNIKANFAEMRAQGRLEKSMRFTSSDMQILKTQTPEVLDAIAKLSEHSKDFSKWSGSEEDRKAVSDIVDGIYKLANSGKLPQNIMTKLMYRFTGRIFTPAPVCDTKVEQLSYDPATGLEDTTRSNPVRWCVTALDVDGNMVDRQWYDSKDKAITADAKYNSQKDYVQLTNFVNSIYQDEVFANYDDWMADDLNKATYKAADQLTAYDKAVLLINDPEADKESKEYQDAWHMILANWYGTRCQAVDKARARVIERLGISSPILDEAFNGLSFDETGRLPQGAVMISDGRYRTKEQQQYVEAYRAELEALNDEAKTNTEARKEAAAAKISTKEKIETELDSYLSGATTNTPITTRARIERDMALEELTAMGIKPEDVNYTLTNPDRSQQEKDAAQRYIKAQEALEAVDKAKEKAISDAMAPINKKLDERENMSVGDEPTPMGKIISGHLKSDPEKLIYFTQGDPRVDGVVRAIDEDGNPVNASGITPTESGVGGGALDTILASQVDQSSITEVSRADEAKQAEDRIRQDIERKIKIAQQDNIPSLTAIFKNGTGKDCKIVASGENGGYMVSVDGAEPREYTPEELSKMYEDGIKAEIKAEREAAAEKAKLDEEAAKKAEEDRKAAEAAGGSPDVVVKPIEGPLTKLPTDDRGNLLVDAFTPEQAYEFLERNGLERMKRAGSAAGVAKDSIAALDKEIEALQKKKVTSTNPEEMQSEMAANDQELERLMNERDMWYSVLDEAGKHQLADPNYTGLVDSTEAHMFYLKAPEWARLMDLMSKKFGLKLKMINDPNWDNGKNTRGVITINMASYGDITPEKIRKTYMDYVTAVMGHEVTHTLFRNNYDAMRAFVDLSHKYLGDETWQREMGYQTRLNVVDKAFVKKIDSDASLTEEQKLDLFYKQIEKEKGLDPAKETGEAYVEQELACNMAGQLLTSADFVKSLVEPKGAEAPEAKAAETGEVEALGEKTGLLGTIRDLLEQFWNIIRGFDATIDNTAVAKEDKLRVDTDKDNVDAIKSEREKLYEELQATYAKLFEDAANIATKQHTAELEAAAKHEEEASRKLRDPKDTTFVGAVGLAKRLKEIELDIRKFDINYNHVREENMSIDRLTNLQKERTKLETELDAYIKNNNIDEDFLQEFLVNETNLVTLSRVVNADVIDEQRKTLPVVDPWAPSFPEKVTTHTVINSRTPKTQELRKRAKAGDLDAARELVKKAIKPEKVMAMKLAHPDAMIAFVHANEESGRNVLPGAFAGALSAMTGLPLDKSIVQVNKPHHTGASEHDRIVRQSRFGGDVIAGQEYIICDDQFTAGGTLRCMREYIESKGGKVVDVTTLTASMRGTQIKPSKATLDELYVLGVDDAHVRALGITDKVANLTEGEAKGLIKIAKFGPYADVTNSSIFKSFGNDFERKYEEQQSGRKSLRRNEWEADRSLESGLLAERGGAGSFEERQSGSRRLGERLLEEYLSGTDSINAERDMLSDIEHERFSKREEPAPKRRKYGYKAFKLIDGQLFPPKVKNTVAGDKEPTKSGRIPTDIGIFLNADAGLFMGKQGKEERGKVAQDGGDTLSYRPGWHLGYMPFASQFLMRGKNAGKAQGNIVYALVEFDSTNDYSLECDAYGMSKNGAYVHAMAGVPYLPKNGYYEYRTNIDPSTSAWAISGAMRVLNILSREEEAEILSRSGVAHPEVNKDKLTPEALKALNDEIDANLRSTLSGSEYLRVIDGIKAAKQMSFDEMHAFEYEDSESSFEGPKKFPTLQELDMVRNAEEATRDFRYADIIRKGGPEAEELRQQIDIVKKAHAEEENKKILRKVDKAYRAWLAEKVKTMDNVSNSEILASSNVDAPDPEYHDVIMNGDEFVASVNPDAGEGRFSLRTWEEGGHDAFLGFLADLMTDPKRLTPEEAKILEAEMKKIYDMAKAIYDSGEFKTFNEWSYQPVKTTASGDVIYSVIKKNNEYDMNLDFSLVCKKRRTLDAVLNLMIDRGLIDKLPANNNDTSGMSTTLLNDVIRQYGFETACRLCFVDAKRFRQFKVADDFVQLYNGLVNQIIPRGSGIKADYFDFSENGLHDTNEGALHTLTDNQVEAGLAKLRKKVEDEDKRKGNAAGRTVTYKIAKHLLEHPEDRRLVQRSDFVSSKGFDGINVNNPDVLTLYNSKKGAGGPKALESDQQYLNDIAKANWSREKAKKVGGVRVQSFSDFVPHLVFDYLQMFSELAAGKYPAHAYTKERLFVQLFGKTGIKINMSLVPDVVEGGVAPGLDKDGNYVWAIKKNEDGTASNVESFDYDLACKIQDTEGYRENCGTIAVGISDAHIRKMMVDPNIRMIIPYHKSNINRKVAVHNRLNTFTDYTNSQNTRYKSTGEKLSDADHAKKEKNYNVYLEQFKDPNNAAEAYVRDCEKNGWIPKFDQFLGKDAKGRYIVTDGYYKMLEDYTTNVPNGKGGFDYYPQREVRFEFPEEGDPFGSLGELMREGLGEDEDLETRRRENVAPIVDEIEKRLGLKTDPVEARMKQIEGDRSSKREFKPGDDILQHFNDVREMTPVDRFSLELDIMRDTFDDDARFSIGGRRKSEMAATLEKKRPDLNSIDRDLQIKAIEAFGNFETSGKGNPKLEKIATYWVANGSLTFHGIADQNARENVRKALAIAEDKHIDPFMYKNPLELIQQYQDWKPKEKPIDPHDVPEFHYQKSLGDIDIYVVDDNEAGQLAVRKVIDSHWGKDANPWCLASRDPQTGKLYGSSWEYWSETYNGVPKRIAFRNGKLEAFNAQESTYEKSTHSAELEASDVENTDEFRNLIESYLQFVEDENGDEYTSGKLTLDAIAEDYGDEAYDAFKTDYWNETIEVRDPEAAAELLELEFGNDYYHEYDDVPESGMVWWDRQDEDHNGLRMSEDLGNGKKADRYIDADGNRARNEIERVYKEDKKKGLYIEYDSKDTNEVSHARMADKNDLPIYSMTKQSSNLTTIHDWVGTGSTIDAAFRIWDGELIEANHKIKAEDGNTYDEKVSWWPTDGSVRGYSLICPRPFSAQAWTPYDHVTNLWKVELHDNSSHDFTAYFNSDGSLKRAVEVYRESIAKFPLSYDGRALIEADRMYFTHELSPEEREFYGLDAEYDNAYKDAPILDHDGLVELLSRNGSTRLLDVIETNGQNLRGLWQNILDLDPNFNSRKAEAPSLNPEEWEMPEERFSRRVAAADPFYSNAARGIAEAKQEKASGDQWISMLRNKGQLKPEEDKWLGLSDWLRGKKGVTKQELMDYVEQNAVKVEDVKYAANTTRYYEDPQDVANFAHNIIGLDRNDFSVDKKGYVSFAGDLDYAFVTAKEINDEYKLVNPQFYSLDNTSGKDSFVGDVEEYLSELIMRESGLATQDHKINEIRMRYTMQGLMNKREIALVTPGIEPYYGELPDVHFTDQYTGGRAVAWIRFGEAWESAEKEKYHVAYNTFTQEMEAKYGPSWEMRMTPEEDEMYNKLGEARDREYHADSKVLVIDEIQSQRHQDGREKGYLAKEIEDEFNQVSQESQSLTIKELNSFSDPRQKLTPAEKERSRYLAKRYSELVGIMNNSVKDAPFHKNWHELAMKRMLRYAAENGYDKIAWTTGKQQANRYSLARDVESIDYKNVEGRKRIVIKLKAGWNYRFGVDQNGIIGSEPGDILMSAFVGKHLKDVIGKELADEVLAGEQGTIKEEGLKAGYDKGMQGFYDDMLPRFMNKYGRKWGVKVGDITLDLPNKADRVMHSVDVTPAMKQSVMDEGQALWSKRDLRKDIVDRKDKAASAYETFLKDAQERYGERWKANLTNDEWDQFYLLKNNAAQMAVAETAWDNAHNEDPLRDKAIEAFGTTTNFRKAAYVLPDGRMLDFSEGQDQRADDHRDIGRVYDQRPEIEGMEDSSSTVYMTDFMRRGNIRFMPEVNGFELVTMPTDQQWNTLSQYIRRVGGNIELDFSDGNKTFCSAEYDHASPAKIAADINRYFVDGIRPESEARWSRRGTNVKSDAELKNNYADVPDTQELFVTLQHDNTKDYDAIDEIIRRVSSGEAELELRKDMANSTGDETKVGFAARIIASGSREDETRPLSEQSAEIENDIQRYAESRGLWLQEDAIASQYPLTLPKGTSSSVYFNRETNKVCKLAHIRDKQRDSQSVAQFIDSIFNFNAAVPSLPYDIKGFARDSEGHLCIVLEQDLVQGKPLDKVAEERGDYGTWLNSQLKKARKAMGYGRKDIKNRDYVWTYGPYEIGDTHGGNIVVTPGGDYYLIDADVELPESDGKDLTFTDTRDSKRAQRESSPAFKRWFGDWEQDPENASKVVDEEGRPLIVHHGTQAYGFTIFNTLNNWDANNNIGSHFGGHDAASNFMEGGASSHSSQEGDVSGEYNVYLDIRKPYDTYDWFGQEDCYPYWEAIKLAREAKSPQADAIINEIADAYPDTEWMQELRDAYNNKLSEEEISSLVEEGYVESGDDTLLYNAIRELLKMNGYDGIKYWNDIEGDGYCWIALEPNQIKSADTEGPMANNGEFDPNNPDIRYSQRLVDSIVDPEPYDPTDLLGEKGKAYNEIYSNKTLIAYREDVDRTAKMLGGIYGNATAGAFGRNLTSKDSIYVKTNGKPDAEKLMHIGAAMVGNLYDYRDQLKRVQGYHAGPLTPRDEVFEDVISHVDDAIYYYERLRDGEILDHDDYDIRYSKRAKYGAPYSGSKSDIADDIMSVLPDGKRFVDLFAGGGSMTHAALLSGKYDSATMNDKNPVGIQLFMDGVNGKYKDYDKTYDKESFKAIAGTPEGLLWSYQYNNRDFNDDRSQARIDRVNRLMSLADKKDRISTSAEDYKNVQFNDGDVIYADIPYEDHDNSAYKDAGEFDYDAFWAWASKQDRPIYVSAPKAREGFTEIWHKDVYDRSHGIRTERLFVQDKYAREIKARKFDQDIRNSIRVFHGSGADFDHFDLSFVKSGVGDMVYGHGIYVTSNKEIGRSYAQLARDGNLKVTSYYKGKLVEYPDPREIVSTVADFDKETAISLCEDVVKDPEHSLKGATPEIVEQWKKALDILNSKDFDPKDYETRTNPRHLYQVDIPDDTGKNYLPWDDNCPKSVRLAIGDKIADILTSAEDSGYSVNDKKHIITDFGFDSQSSYGDIYGSVSTALGGDKEASDFFSSLGYAGVKIPVDYGKNDNRREGVNYVIFKPEDAMIVGHDRYSKRSKTPLTPEEQTKVEGWAQQINDARALDDKEFPEYIKRYNDAIAQGIKTTDENNQALPEYSAPRHYWDTINELKPILKQEGFKLGARGIEKIAPKDARKSKRITPEQDAAYMEAVKSGDNETLQRMIEEAAKAAMPESQIVNSKGKLVPMYHGTFLRDYYFNMATGDYEAYNDQPFYVFNTKSRKQLGAHFGTKKQAENRAYNINLDYADQGIMGRNHLYSVYLDIKNPLELEDEGKWNLDKIGKQLIDRGYITKDEYAELKASDEPDYTMKDLLMSKGYDGVLYLNNYEGFGISAIAFEPSQIKSAELVTRDDAGNVIPLSERFNLAKDDIRYARRERKIDSPKDFVADNFRKLNQQSLRDELGWAAKDYKHLGHYLGRDGMSIKQASEEIWDDMPEGFRNMCDDGDIRDWIIEILGEGGPSRYFKTKREIEAAAEEDDNLSEEEKQQREEFYQEAYGMSYEEYLNYEEDIKQRMRSMYGTARKPKIRRLKGESKDDFLERQRVAAKAEQDMQDATAAREQLIKEIQALITYKQADAMTKGELNRLLRQVHNATPTNLISTIRRALQVSREIRTRLMGIELSDLMHLKTKDVNGKNMSIAKNVDNNARMILDNVRDRLYGLTFTDADQTMRGLRSENYRLREENRRTQILIDRGEYGAEGSDEHNNAVQQILDNETKITENNDRIKALEQERDAFVMKSLTEGIGDVEKALEKKMDYMSECADPTSGKHWTQADTVELTTLDVLRARQEVQKLDEELRAAKADRAKATLRSHREAWDTLIDDIERRRLVAVENVLNKVKEVVETGKNNLYQQKAAEIEHQRDMVLSMFGDIDNGNGKRFTQQQLDKNSRAHEGNWKALATSGLGSFEYMAHRIDINHMSHDGWFYKTFITGKRGVMQAENDYITSYHKSMLTLQDKTQEIFGMKIDKLAKEMSTDDENCGVTLYRIIDEDEHGNPTLTTREDLTLSKAEAIYLHMVWKMGDGRAKMQEQGFDELSMQQIRDFIGPKAVDWANWIQGEYLPELFKRYNARYLEIYGTPMTDTENYVPLKISPSSIQSKGTLSGDQAVQQNLNIKNGSQINRTMNLNPVDLSTNAFQVILDHVNEAEEFIAFANVRKDLTALLNNRAIRNQLNANVQGQAEALWNAAEIAVHASKSPQTKTVDELVNKIGKGVIGANIAFRNSTAIKQILSVPAFLGYSQDWRYLLSYLKNVGVQYGENAPAIIANMLSFGYAFKPMLKPLDRGEHTKALTATIAWCAENVPSFFDRIMKGNLGMDIMNESMGDSKYAKFIDAYLNQGMGTNKLVDAVTCAIGIKSMFDYRYARMKEDIDKQGLTGKAYDDALAEAKRVAIMEADIYYNGTQQSNHPAFMAPMQIDRTTLSRMLSVYQNASIGYARKAVESWQNLAKAGHLKRLINTYANELEAQGMTPEEAMKAAKGRVDNRIRKAIVGLLLYGLGMNFVWDIGSRGLNGLYQDDEDWKTALSWPSMISYPLRGLPLANMSVTFINKAVSALEGNGFGGRDYNPLLLMSEINSFMKDAGDNIKNFGYSPITAIHVLSKGSKLTGFDLNVWSNTYLALDDMIRAGFVNKENIDWMTDLMLFLQTPNSLRPKVAKHIYGMDPEEFAKLSDDEKVKVYTDYARSILYAMKYMEEGTWREYIPGTKVLTQDKRSKVMKELWNNLIPEDIKAKVGDENKELKDLLKETKRIDDLDVMYDQEKDPDKRSIIAKSIKKAVEAEEAKETTAETGKSLLEEYFHPKAKKASKSEQEYYKRTSAKDYHDDLLISETLSKLKETYIDQLEDLEDDENTDAYDAFYNTNAKAIDYYYELKAMQSEISKLKKELGQEGSNNADLMKQIREARRNAVSSITKAPK